MVGLVAGVDVLVVGEAVVVHKREEGEEEIKGGTYDVVDECSIF
jgi:hypothetical protein